MSLRVLLAVVLLVGSSRSQRGDEVFYSCTDGYEFNIQEQECKDVDECKTVPDACKGGMRCINHFGGYFCLPQNAQIMLSNGEDDPTAPPVVEERLPEASSRQIVVPGTSVQSSGAGPARVSCAVGFTPDEHNYCRDVDECTQGNPCQQQCYNMIGSFMCQCEQGFQLAADQISCQDVDECSIFSFLCQWRCMNRPGGYGCACPEGYQVHGRHMCQDVNECEAQHNCGEDQMCWNYFGGFRCYPRNPCSEPYVQTGEGRCSCQSLSVCRGLPPVIVYKYMSITSERSLPADLFQIQATSVFPNMHNTFRIKAGNEGGQFILRRSSDVSAMLVMTKGLTGPREHVVDLEMVTQNSGLNYRSSSLLRLTVIVGPYAF